MSSVFFVFIRVLALTLGVAGVLAVTTGRITLPWLRRGVKQPRVWGAGSLLVAASLAATWLVPFRGQSLLMLAGLMLIWRSQGWGHRKAPQAK